MLSCAWLREAELVRTGHGYMKYIQKEKLKWKKKKIKLKESTGINSGQIFEDVYKFKLQNRSKYQKYLAI